jgi:hypothetical protein
MRAPTQDAWLAGPQGGRVAPGRCLAGAPTDPDMRDSRIRLFETRVRYAGNA